MARWVRRVTKSRIFFRIVKHQGFDAVTNLEYIHLFPNNW